MGCNTEDSRTEEKQTTVDLKPLKILLQKLDTSITLRRATRMPNFMGIGVGVSVPRIAKI